MFQKIISAINQSSIAQERRTKFIRLEHSQGSRVECKFLGNWESPRDSDAWEWEPSRFHPDDETKKQFYSIKKKLNEENPEFNFEWYYSGDVLGEVEFVFHKIVIDNYQI